MSFQVPRRQRFPRPLGDNSPYTPPDPPKPIPPPPALPPGFHPPSLAKYINARQKWIATGELEALWDMQDNTAAVPRGWTDEPTPLEAEVVAAADTPVSRDLRAFRFEALAAALFVAGLAMMTVDLLAGSAWWLNLVTLTGALAAAAGGRATRNARKLP